MGWCLGGRLRGGMGVRWGGCRVLPKGKGLRYDNLRLWGGAIIAYYLS